MRAVLRVILLWSLAGLALAGCSYYNTFYNIKKDFRAAERQTELATRQQQAAQPAQAPRQGVQPPRGGSPVVGAQGYQAVIESCSKLLEFYPKSRWVDDALLIMGISYFRMQEYSRAERKFSELVTIFPKSKHVEEAKVWRAKSLIEQGKFDEAEKVLVSSEGELENAQQAAAAYRALAMVQAHRKSDEQAIAYYEKCVALSYDRDEKATDFLNLGKLRYAGGDLTASRKDIQSCLRITRNSDEAYEANLLYAKAAREAGDYDVARITIEDMLRRTAFLSHEQELRLELAVTESQSQNSDQAIALFQDYIDHATTGESKGRAYFLQGLIERDQRREFETAKAKFDSAGPAGATRELADTARSASEQLASVIATRGRLPQLQDSVAQAAVKVEETKRLIEEAQSVVPMETTEADTSQVITEVDSTIAMEVEPDTSAQLADVDTVMTPAELVADSIMRALAVKDSIRRAEMAVADSLATPADTLSMEPPPQVAIDSKEVDLQAELLQSEAELAKAQAALIAAYMDMASFYTLVLADRDSSEYFLREAVMKPSRCEDYSRAKVQLALDLLKADSSNTESWAMLREVAADSNAPVEMRNVALRALGDELLEEEIPEQELLFRAAESAYLADAPVDSVIGLYDEVIRYDSTSAEGLRSLQSIAFLSEYVKRDYSKATTAHEALARLFPDSTFAALSKTKLAPPDTNSVFLASDEELYSTPVLARETLEATADSSGWPPAEETLRGRRFH